MDQRFDIFRKDHVGGLLWCSTANSLGEARATVERLGKIERGIDFVILNQETHEHVTVKAAALSHSQKAG
jgi:hypothetical protein